MKILLLLWLLLGFLPTLCPAALNLRVSVKFILSTTGARPLPTGIGTQAGCEAEIDFANTVLAATGRGYRLVVTEYADIQPPVPAGESSRYWLDLNARQNVVTIDAAARGNTTAWKWQGDAINLFINNSGSGQCCGGGPQKTISLGRDIIRGTILHEIGHLLGLPHTHPGTTDQPCSGLTAPLAQYLGDGDGISDTAPDRSCFTRSELARALFNERPESSLNPAETAWLDSAAKNIMSYHSEEILTSGQMDLWTDTANDRGQFATNGRTVFVDWTNDAFDGLPPSFASYAWWAEMNPLPQPAWGSSAPITITLDPPFPPKPPLWPGNLTWPPLEGSPKPTQYPAGWPWPPVDLPPLVYRIGGPRKTAAAGIDQALAPDTTLFRPGTYNIGSRLNRSLTLRATRGPVRLEP